MSNKLTAAQLTVIAFFDCYDAAAMRLAGRWVWADDIRNDPGLAVRFIKDRAEGYRNSELLNAWLAPQPKDAVRQ